MEFILLAIGLFMVGPGAVYESRRKPKVKDMWGYPIYERVMI